MAILERHLLGDSVWRIGLMGRNATLASVELVLGALRDVLKG